MATLPDSPAFTSAERRVVRLIPVDPSGSRPGVFDRPSLPKHRIDEEFAGLVGRTDHGATGTVQKLEFLLGYPFPLVEREGVNEGLDGQMVGRRLEILSQRHDIDLGLAEIHERLVHFVIILAMAQHDAGFRVNFRS